MDRDPLQLNDAVLTSRRWTYAELSSAIPESNRPCELWEGELIMSPAPSCDHQEIVHRLYRALFAWVDARQLGRVFTAPVDVVLSPREVVQPDVLYISQARVGLIRRAIEGAPDLVVEVVSKGGRHRDAVEKRDLYGRYGVREYWLVDPELQAVDLLRLEGTTYREVGRVRRGEVATSQLLPGFSIEVEALLAGVPGGV